MNERRFIELLNLYVDGEISAADAAALEQAILASPERRRIYRRYCQMQRACAELALRQRENDAQGAGSTVVPFPVPAPRRRTGWQVALYGLSSVAAACFVFVVARWAGSESEPGGAGTATPVAAQARVETAVAVPAVHDLVLLAKPWDRRPGWAALPASLGDATVDERFEQAPVSWMVAAPPPPAALQFRPQPVVPPDGRVYHGPGRVRSGEVEFSALQFAR